MDKITKSSLLGAIIAAIVSSLCCIGPMILLMLGIGGAWVSMLTNLSFLRPIWIILSILFLGIAFWKLYITPRGCSIDQSCINAEKLRWYRVIFFIIAIVLVGLIAFPWYKFLFY